jgi:hypothetical protein
MNRQIDRAFQQSFFDFLGEQPLAADFRQRPVLHPVAGRHDGDDLDLVFVKAMGGAKPRARFMGLR